MNRRDFIKLLGTASGATIVTSCGLKKKTDKLIPYLVPPEDGFIPGQSVYYSSTCTECPAHCGLSVKVVEKLHEREHRRYPIKLEGAPGHPTNDGALCIRGQSSLTRLYHPERLRTPVIRDEKGAFKPIGWEEALKRIGEALAQAKEERLESYYLSSRVTGTLSELIDLFCRDFGMERLPDYELFSHASLREANRILFGKAAVPLYRIDEADFLLTVGADILDTHLSPVFYTSLFVSADSRGSLNWYHAEPHVTLTGRRAHARLSINPGSEPHLLAYLLRAQAEGGASSRKRLPEELLKAVPAQSLEEVSSKTGIEEGRLTELQAALAASSRPLVIAGGVSTQHAQGLETGLLAGLIQWATGATTGAAGAGGGLVDFSRRENYGSVGSAKELLELAQKLEGRPAGVFIVSKANGLAKHPALVDAVKKSRYLVGMTDQRHGVMKECDMVLPLSHSLESWGDAEPRRGLRTIVQPVLKPLHGTLSEGDVLLELMKAGGHQASEASYQEFLLSRLKKKMGEGGLEELLAKGYSEEKVSSEPVRLDTASTLAHLKSLSLAEELPKPVLVLTPSVRTFDGRSSDLPLLSEIPDPMATISYGRWISISEETAKAERLKDGDEVELRGGAFQLTLPVKTASELPAGVLTLQHDMTGPIPYAVDPRGGEFIAYYPGITLRKTNGALVLPILSGPVSFDEREIIPKEGHRHEGEEHKATLYPEHEHPDYRWAMAIDLDRCTGCSACVAACYIENNIPVVGPKEHIRGREMSWIRIEQHEIDDGSAGFMPMMCQHCDNAPCEPVCPVYAAYHNNEGLNAQVYNRCVGTRYCSNNCPYKVRRFNWFDHEWPEPMDKMQNPDVTVRSRGIMEKCTFCVQRIRLAKDQAKDEGRKVADGEVTPACAQTCPANAIVFGNLKDEESEVHKWAKRSDAYRAYELLGTEPAVYYIKGHQKKAKA